jgi:hypothetical protein
MARIFAFSRILARRTRGPLRSFFDGGDRSSGSGHVGQAAKERFRPPLPGRIAKGACGWLLPCGCPLGLDRYCTLGSACRSAID